MKGQHPVTATTVRSVHVASSLCWEPFGGKLWLHVTTEQKETFPTNGTLESFIGLLKEEGKQNKKTQRHENHAVVYAYNDFTGRLRFCLLFGFFLGGGGVQHYLGVTFDLQGWRFCFPILDTNRLRPREVYRT